MSSRWCLPPSALKSGCSILMQMDSLIQSSSRLRVCTLSMETWWCGLLSRCAFHECASGRGSGMYQEQTRSRPDPTYQKQHAPQQMCSLLEFCLGCTYFVFNGQFNRQIHRAAVKVYQKETLTSPMDQTICQNTSWEWLKPCIHSNRKIQKDSIVFDILSKFQP